MNIYCLRCKRKQPADHTKMVKDRRGKSRMAGKCHVCNCKVSQYVSGNSKSRSVSRRRSRYRKRSPSKTRKGRQDFVTHKGSKVYDIHGHYVRKSRKPYRKSRSHSRRR